MSKAKYWAKGHKTIPALAHDLGLKTGFPASKTEMNHCSSQEIAFL